MLLDRRQPIGLILLAVTAFMGYWALHVPIATRFEDLFPSAHPNTVLYRQFREAYGGAQTLVLMLRVKDGDIFTPHTLHAIQDMNEQVNALSGVNHNELFSLASYRVLYARALPGVLKSEPFMYPKVPATPAGIADLKSNVLMHREQLAGLVTGDLKGALVVASFNEGTLDYLSVFNDVQKIIREHQDANTTIYASGPVMFAAWGYHYLPRIEKIFGASFALMLLLTWLCLGRRRGWWAPAVTAVGSAVWGVGFMSLMGYNFDPAMLVLPLVMTARNLGHGIQWQGRFYDEFDRLDDRIAACVTAAEAMLWPGLVAVLITIAGIAFVAVGSIPVLRQLGIGGAVWLGASLVTVFAGQPILISYLSSPEPQRAGAGARRGGRDWLASLTLSAGWFRFALIGVGALALVVGLVAERHVLIGYQTPGTPIYQEDAKINRDTAEIARFVPTNTAWVVLETPEFPSPQSTMGTQTMRMGDDLAAYLIDRGDAVAVIGFGNVGEKPMNMLLHNGFPKFMAIPDSEMLSANLWGFFFGAAAPDEPKTYFAYQPSARNGRILMLLPDHTAARLSRLRSDLDNFVRDRVTPDHALNQVKLRYLGGEAGLYLAINDTTRRLNSLNLALVLSAIFVLGAIMARSLLDGRFLVLIAIAANFLGFAYLNHEAIGLTTDTISVISLGMGLGLCFAVYLLAGIQEGAATGLALDDAVRAAIHGPGRWVISTFLVMVAGLAPWAFSPLLFQNEMSLILILLMITNLIAAMLILPAWLVWAHPRFLTRARN
ncbi:MAG: efflux RND transporter permease subunit [Candidatus Binataceae bacterium]